MTFKTYQPTAELTVRNKDTYYTAFKEFCEELAEGNNLIAVTSDDENYTVSIHPTSPNITSRCFTIRFQSNNAHNGFYCNGYFVSHLNYSADISFFVYSNDNEFTVGITNYPIVFGILLATDYNDGSKIHFTIETVEDYYGYSVSLYVNSNNSITSLDHAHPTFYREAGGTTDVYRFIEYPLSNTSYVCDNIFYVDGGLSLPPSQFSVDGVEYVTFLEGKTNICYRLS